MTPSEVGFDPAGLIEVLDRHGVVYVLVGGYAAQLHGSSRPTNDMDVTPATDRDNLARLAAALKELGASIRVDGMAEGLPFDTSAQALAGMLALNLRTPHGDLDLTFTPSGTNGYDDLKQAAPRLILGGIEIQLASLSDIIRSKEAAGRPKDLAALAELYRLASPERTRCDMRRSPTPWMPASRFATRRSWHDMRILGRPSTTTVHAGTSTDTASTSSPRTSPGSRCTRHTVPAIAGTVSTPAQNDASQALTRARREAAAPFSGTSTVGTVCRARLRSRWCRRRSPGPCR